MTDRFELVVSADGQSAKLVRVGSVGELSGDVGTLAKQMGTDAYALRCAIASGAVPAEFLGSGRYRIDGDVVARGVDRDGRPRQVERGLANAVGQSEPAQPSFVDSLRSLPKGPPAYEAAVQGELARRQQLLADGVDWTQASPRYIPPEPFDRGRFSF